MEKMKPTAGNVMIKLPAYQKEGVRQSDGGIYIPHLSGNFSLDVSHGTVVALGDGIELCEIGDEVFFAQNCIQAALQNSGMDKTRSEANKNRGSGIPVFYLADDSGDYVFMPEKRLFLLATDTAGGQEMECDIHGGIICIIRKGEIICVNSYHIMKNAYDAGEVKDGVRTKKHGLIDVVVFHEENEKNKRFEIVSAPVDSELKSGDIIFTKPHCDLKLEGDFNYPLLPKGSFYVVESNILGKFVSESIEGFVPLAT